MSVVEILYVAFSGILVVSGLMMVGMAVRAYARTKKRAMVHLSLGFSFVVAASASTVISAFLNDFEGVRSLLLANSGLSSIGFTFVVYSLVAYRA